MTDSISVIGPGWRATDANGTVITDGVLHFYSAGTTTPLEVFSDANLTSSLGVAVSCDSGGYPVTSGNVKTIIYTGVQPYKMILVSSTYGTNIWEHDYIRPASQIVTATNTPVAGQYARFVDESTIEGVDGISGYVEVEGTPTAGQHARFVDATTVGGYALSPGELIAIIEDQKAQGAWSGTFASGDWQLRVLNTPTYNKDSLVTLSADKFTLPAGKWLITWSAPAFKVDSHKTLLHNYTTDAYVAYGSSENTSAADSVTTRSAGSCVVDIASEAQYGVRHRCSTTCNNVGFGNYANFGTEVFTRVEIYNMS